MKQIVDKFGIRLILDETEQLQNAVSYNDFKKAKECLEQGANPNGDNKYSIKPLMIATAQGSLEIVKILIKQGADINGKDKNGNNALVYCSDYGYAKGIAKLLVDNGIEINHRNKDGETALEKITNNYHFEMAKYLVENGADYKSINKALVESCSRNSWKFTKLNQTKADEFLNYLISYNADVNTKNSIGVSALQNAVLMDKLETIKTLLCNGADINYKNDLGSTALMYACKKENLEITNLLINNGADVNIKNKEGKTAFNLTENKQIKTLLKSKMQITPKAKTKSKSNDFVIDM